MAGIAHRFKPFNGFSTNILFGVARMMHLGSTGTAIHAFPIIPFEDDVALSLPRVTFEIDIAIVIPSLLALVFKQYTSVNNASKCQ